MFAYVACGALRLARYNVSALANEGKPFTGLPIPGRPAPLTSLSTNYGVSLDVSWELDVWGRLRSGRSAAAARSSSPVEV